MFTLYGHVNRQNCHCSTGENPRWMREFHIQRPQNINAWAGIIRDCIVGLFFFNGNVTGETYLTMLQEELIPTLVNLFPNNLNPNLFNQRMWLQQDGAPLHFAQLLTKFSK